MTRDDQIAAARRLWLLVREQVGGTPAAVQDQRRLQGVLAERRTKSQEFFSSSAGQWDRLRDELFGERFHLHALRRAGRARLGRRRSRLRHRAGQRGARAVCARSVIAVDASAAMLQAARKRLQAFDNVDLRRGELEALPIDDATARCGDADAGAASRAGARAGARRGRAGAASPAAGSSSSTCCRTIARATGSRWATCGSGFRRTRCDGCSTGAGFDGRAGSSRCRPTRERRDRRCSSQRPERDVRIRSTNRSSRLQVEPSHRQAERGEEHGTVAEKMHPFAAAKAAGREPYKVQEPGRRRVRPQGNPARRAGNARPDGAAQAARRQRSRWPARASWAACT